MYKEVLPNIYLIEIPLPNNPLKALNSYLIKGPERNLMIDTGMNRVECLEAMNLALEKLDVKLEDTDFFITHMHADHSGLVGTLATPTSKVYCSELDAAVLSGKKAEDKKWVDPLEAARAHGFPEEELKFVVRTHPGHRYASRDATQFDTVQDGDSIEVGDYHFKCIATPGHTEGHMCLYDANKKVLVSGDHILDRITPNISLFSDQGNPLDQYLTNLDKVYPLDVELTLPGHRNLIYDVKKRIQELKDHHQDRIQEILGILSQGHATAYKIASQMKWRIKCPSWQEFPTPQKWFATGEAIAHLRYLEAQGTVGIELVGDKRMYFIK